MSTQGDVPSILIVAAEASSALYAERILEYWQNSGVAIRSFGVGSEKMRSLGFDTIGRSEDMAVVGLQEVIRHFSKIYRVGRDILEECKKNPPSVALLLDYPGFNLRLACKLKKMGIPVVYYVSPQVWAWKTGRVKTIRKCVDQMLVLFPFEVEFYKKHGVDAEFVGHPLLDELATQSSESAELRDFKRQKYGFRKEERVLGLMPGSRSSEIRHHLLTQLQTAYQMVQENPLIRPALLVAPSLQRDQLVNYLDAMERNGTGLVIPLIKDEPFRMIDLCDVILCASGTATLMVGLMQKPMVIMYKMNPITAFFARLLVRHTRFFGMVNLVMDRAVVPELFQQEAVPEILRPLLLKMLVDPKEHARIVADLSILKDRLGRGGATARVVKILSRYLENHP